MIKDDAPAADLDYMISQIKGRKQAIEVLEREIEDFPRAEYGERVLAYGNYTSPVGKIELRKAYQTCSYDAKIVSIVQSVLEESAPYLAAQLEGAKKITFRGESWSVR